MSVNFSNFPQNDAFNIANIKKTKNNNDISFKSNDVTDTEGSQGAIPACNHTIVQVHPLVALNMQLLKDGFSMEQINEHSLYLTRKVADVDFSNPLLLQAAQQGVIKKDDIFSKSMKSIDDIKAMQKAYISLKKKFNTDDVRAHVDKFRKLENEISQFLAKRGHNSPQESKYSSKSMILSILHYVNKDNEPLLQKLLQDKNFNNICIKDALLNFGNPKDIKYGLKVLEMAQEIGYDKDFSLPLAILISEAKEENMPIIEKILNEQDFFVNNDDFVSNELINFVRHPYSGFAPVYIGNEDITLNEIQELIEMDTEDDD